MVAVIWSPKSLTRINEIAAYLEDVSGSSDVANQFVQSILNSVIKLETFPNIGRMVPDYEDPTLREIIHQKYRIIYSVNETRVEILTVEHCSRILRL